ncbi:MAG: hypothetical protein JNN07_16235 [Verrucomicrobiales bacterium]|nr:hypothetical protein [Verrucomicrobiales bacterium]
MRTMALRNDLLSDTSDAVELATELPLRLGRPTDSSDLFDPVAEVAGAADEGFLPLVVASVILLILCASAWVVYAAPTLFAELLIDGVLVSALCHRLSTEDRRNWLVTALQHTLAPFLLTMAVAWLGGTALADWFPKAQTIGDVLFR